MYHTSPTPIEEGTIDEFGVAGDCLFFSDDVYIMTASSTVYVYEADFDCIEAFRLDDAEIITEIAERFGVDEDTAERLLDARENACPYSDSAEDAWWLQGKRGEAAVKMGFDGCKDEDEQGTVYIVPMAGRESELTLVRIDNA